MTTYTVFTDDRIPETQIRWFGGATFNIHMESYVDQSWPVVDMFTHYGSDCNEQTSMSEAQKIALEHFEEMLEEG